MAEIGAPHPAKQWLTSYRTVAALTFSKDTILTFFNSPSATDHHRSADRFPPSINTAELNHSISAWINEPWHESG